MDDFELLINMIDKTVTVDVYPDYVPESETGPAVALTNLSNGNSNRDLAGVKAKGPSTWRVTIVASKTADVISLVKELEKLDNTTQIGFQNVFVDYVLMEPKQPGQSYRRAFVDVKLYK